jgi:hypothetical protein
MDRFPGMPLFRGHLPLQVLTYRSPQGIRASGAQPWGLGNDAGLGHTCEYVLSTSHSGAHIDALAHMTIGEDDHWFCGAARTHLGDLRNRWRRYRHPADLDTFGALLELLCRASARGSLFARGRHRLAQARRCYPWLWPSVLGRVRLAPSERIDAPIARTSNSTPEPVWAICWPRYGWIRRSRPLKKSSCSTSDPTIPLIEFDDPARGGFIHFE